MGPCDGSDAYVGSTCMGLKIRLWHHIDFAKKLSKGSGEIYNYNSKRYRRIGEVGVSKWEIILTIYLLIFLAIEKRLGSLRMCGFEPSAQT